MGFGIVIKVDTVSMMLLYTPQNKVSQQYQHQRREEFGAPNPEIYNAPSRSS